jgi:hypothetical protein
MKNARIGILRDHTDNKNTRLEGKDTVDQTRRRRVKARDVRAVLLTSVVQGFSKQRSQSIPYTHLSYDKWEKNRSHGLGNCSLVESYDYLELRYDFWYSCLC